MTIRPWPSMPKLTAQDLASYAAVIVAAVALYVGWDQAQIGRAQQHADVYPVIQLKSQYLLREQDGISGRHFKLTAYNAGVGPAFAETATWQIKGTNIGHASEISQLFPEGLSSYDQYQGQFSNFILGPGEEEVIWEVVWPNDEASRPLTQEFVEDIWAMQLDICYCSLYEKCWIASYQGESARPPEVKQCSAN